MSEQRPIVYASKLELKGGDNDGTMTAIATIDAIKAILVEFGDVIIELIRATQANPLMGIMVSIVTVNILRKAKVIDPAVEKTLLFILSSAAGIDLLKDLLGILTGSNSDLVKPVPSTLTHAENTGASTEDLTAKLLPLLKMIPK